jgi:hypothetical protein
MSRVWRFSEAVKPDGAGYCGQAPRRLFTQFALGSVNGWYLVNIGRFARNRWFWTAWQGRVR